MISLTLDEDTLAEERRAKLAFSIAQPVKWVTLSLALTITLAWYFQPAYPQFVVYNACVLPLFFASWFYPTLYQKGYKKTGIRLLVIFLFMASFGGNLIFPECVLSVAVLQGGMYLVTYLLLGSREARWAVGTMLAVFAVQMVLFGYLGLHLFPALNATHAFLINLLISLSIAAGTVIMIHLTTSEQDQLYRQQEKANRQLDLAAQQSQQSRERLERMVHTCVAYMTEISRGNMLVRLSLDAEPDEPMQVLGKNLEAMTGTLRGMILQLKMAAENLNRAAAEILAAAMQQVSGASEQSTAISQTTTTVEEVKAIAEQAMQRAQELAGLSQQSVEVVRSGKQSVSDTVQGMQQIRHLVEHIAENTLSLSEETQKISDIIATVNDIAAQSNMLALNASIEAARAGEQGKGFGIVASEMRSLAEQSRQATEQVKAILTAIQQATNATVMVTEEGSKGADQGVSLVKSTGQAIEGLAQAIEEAAQVAFQMAAGGRQQMAGVDQVAIAMKSINQATVQNLASTRQTERAAQDLNLLAGSLTTMIAGYQVS